MKKLILIILFIFISILQVNAETNILQSQTGIVKNIEYVDTKLQNEQATKQLVTVKIATGEYKGMERVLENMLTGNPAYDIPLKVGDKVVLHLETDSDNISDFDNTNIYIADLKRNNQIWLFAIIFSALLVLIGRKKGIRSIISIIATICLIFFLMIPMILNGINPICASVIIGILSTIITLYLVGGLNSKSSSAIIGTSISLIFAGLLSIFGIVLAHLTGFTGEDAMFLYASRPDLDFTGILSASMIIAALGALMDTSVSIASTINEIHETDNSLSVSQLFKSGMNVGKDIIGTMSNTLILVYLGSSLPLVLLSSNIDLNKFFNLNQVATEILSALTGSIAILACVPITAIITAFFIKRFKEKPNFNMKHIDID